MISAEVEIKVEFYDVDPMHVVWHGNYARFLEVARGALLDKIGYNYPQMKAGGWSFPIVDMSFHYTRPAVHAQRLKVRATLVEWENRLKVDYLISDAPSGQRLTKASTTQVAVKEPSGELSFASPPELVEQVQRLLG